jgi:hypothetical protein
LEGKAKIWFEGFLVGDHDLPNWEGFAISLCIRLYSKKDVVEEYLTSRLGVFDSAVKILFI